MQLLVLWGCPPSLDPTTIKKKKGFVTIYSKDSNLEYILFFKTFNVLLDND